MGDEIVIELTAHEMEVAAYVGMRRQVSAMFGGRQNSWTNADNPFDIHILGCCGELVVAKTLNLYWHNAIGSISSHDVGGLVEVRCRRNQGWLGVRDNHKPKMPYVLVHADMAKFKLVGWIYGADGWRCGKQGDNPKLRYVPPTLPPLRPISELIEGLCPAKI